ncbi:MAG: FtsX-like permease family protein [Lentisphaerae bacterium]|jgi:putative ABC transport system permease protein|nr:FtsX-like permease family protein [Lentisphaerota bacterium]MBT5611534.1 FtsX-like permease family protein [Lentisphaerota bacterium]MBT7059561.1 FtsX-like permease family protein [Lentisphaerota bacterium]MBT7844961.1 FtsX-like permease family protein [Lentisphaerota bacterium]
MGRIFDERRQGVAHGVVLPWRRTLEVCWANIRHRMGRCLLTFVCIAVVVAFFASSMTYQVIVSDLMASEDIHTQAVLEKAGVFTHDKASLKRQRDQQIWLMSLSAFLCLVGITNTILMSVTERYREIGTLKCLGALDSFVVRLFLVESIFVGVLASASGAVVGFGLGILQVGAVLEFSLLGLSSCARGFGIGVGEAIGLGTILTTLAAVYPTYVAAKMKPVEAMRVEV